MSNNFKYTAGLNNVGSYQVSGMPFVTSSNIPASGAATPHWKIEFPYLTKEITICNAAGTSHDLIRIAFSEQGLKDQNAYYFLVGSTKDGDGSTTLNVKATELYVMSDSSHTPMVSIYASMTFLPVERVNNISPSGSNWSGSAGIG